MNQFRATIVHQLLAVLIGVLGFSSPSYASWFKKTPLKLQTCELLLSDKLTSLQQKGSPLSSLRGAIFKLRSTMRAADQATSYKDVSYQGDVRKMNSATREKIVERLNAIEQHLTSTNLDSQIVSVEFRGERDIVRALAEIETLKKELTTLYRDQSKRSFLWKLYAGALHAVFTTGSLFTVLELLGILPGEVSAFDLYGAVYAGFVYHMAYLYRANRFDRRFIGLKEFLGGEERTTDDVYFSGSDIVIPVEFHRMLLSDEKNFYGELEKEARQQGITSWGFPYIMKKTKEYWDFYRELIPIESLRREVLNAGETDRTVFLDQIVYFDEMTNEPVWLFFYRSFRSRPAGSKPRKKEDREAAKEQTWIPGAQPIPVLGR